MKTGISKQRPKARRNLSVRLRYSRKEIIGLRKSVEKLTKEAEGRRQRDEIAEQDAADEQDRGEEDERKDVFLFVLVQPRGDEAPDLEEGVGGRQEQGGEEGDLHVDEEGLREPGEDHRALGRHGVDEGFGDHPEGPVLEQVADAETDADDDEDADQPRLELFEVRRSGAFFLLRAFRFP